jgi:integrase
VAKHYEWTPEEISKFISASEDLANGKHSRYDYSTLLRLLLVTGLRVSEALALQWRNVGLLNAELRVEHSLQRNGELGAPKTEAGTRIVPLSPGLVDSLLKLKPLDAEEDAFVFASRSNPHRPLSYWNLRNRGFQKTLGRSGLDGNGITIHSLRSAAISLYAARGLSMFEVAELMGQKNPDVTWRHYARLFDRRNVFERARQAQGSV